MLYGMFPYAALQDVGMQDVVRRLTVSPETPGAGGQGRERRRPHRGGEQGPTRHGHAGLERKSEPQPGPRDTGTGNV